MQASLFFDITEQMKSKQLSKKDVEHIARLARLNLSQKELEKFQRQLGEIFSYFEKTQKLDTTTIEPTSQVTGLENITRQDSVITEQNITASQALQDTHDKHNDFFQVEAIFEGDSHES